MRSAEASAEHVAVASGLVRGLGFPKNFHQSFGVNDLEVFQSLLEDYNAATRFLLLRCEYSKDFRSPPRLAKYASYTSEIGRRGNRRGPVLDTKNEHSVSGFRECFHCVVKADESLPKAERVLSGLPQGNEQLADIVVEGLAYCHLSGLRCASEQMLEHSHEAKS